MKELLLPYAKDADRWPFKLTIQERPMYTEARDEKEHGREQAKRRRLAVPEGLIDRAVLQGDTLAFSPPLIITEAEIGEMMKRFGQALDETTQWVEENGLRDKKPD